MGERVVCVALAQMRVVGGDPAGNLARSREAVRRGAEAGAEVVVLPECLDLGWAHPSAAALAAPIPGPRTDALAEAAVACRVHVVAGLVERDGGNVYSGAVALDDRGVIVLHHRRPRARRASRHGATAANAAPHVRDVGPGRAEPARGGGGRPSWQRVGGPRRSGKPR